jgi:ABC-type nitrate/sulfonate/bicarbonate transport system substrate-binding protein
MNGQPSDQTRDFAISLELDASIKNQSLVFEREAISDMSHMQLEKYAHALACLVFGGLAISLTVIKSHAADKVRVGLSAISLPNAPMWIAEEKQIFKKYDIEPELIVVGGGATRSVSAVIAGDLQFATAGGGAIISASLSGADVVMVAAGNNKGVQRLVVKPEIKTPEAIKTRG